MAELYRTTGAGNDFLALVEPAANPSAGTIRAWCRRGVSLGADGVFVVRRERSGGEGMTAVAMDYWNADGGEAALCVNATRCAAQLAFHLGWTAERVTVRTGAGPFAARRRGDDVIELELAPPSDEPRALGFTDQHGGWAMTVGVPHAIIRWNDDLATCPVDDLGQRVRRLPCFGAAGANANFVRFPSAHELEIRTFERGVEAETLACGSGVLAAVAVGVATGVLELPVRGLTKGGFVLVVDGETAADGRHIARWTMAGDARILARLQTCEAAEQPLPEPAWS
jgi:diaminopimelate epimerase